MPTKNIDLLGPGTLYFYPPEGGDAVALGEVRSAEVITAYADPVDDIGVHLACPAPGIESETWTVELKSVSMQGLWYLTRDLRIIWNWARVNRPRLQHLSIYAKRPRARRKNFIRIVREFLEG